MYLDQLTHHIENPHRYQNVRNKIFFHSRYKTSTYALSRPRKIEKTEKYGFGTILRPNFSKNEIFRQNYVWCQSFNCIWLLEIELRPCKIFSYNVNHLSSIYLAQFQYNINKMLLNDDIILNFWYVKTSILFAFLTKNLCILTTWHEMLYCVGMSWLVITWAWFTSMTGSHSLSNGQSTAEDANVCGNLEEIHFEFWNLS